MRQLPSRSIPLAAALVLVLAPIRAQGSNLRTYANTTGGTMQSMNQTQSASIQTFLVPDDQAEAVGCFELAAPRKAFHFLVPPGAPLPWRSTTLASPCSS